jgi:hypothetical protein
LEQVFSAERATVKYLRHAFKASYKGTPSKSTTNASSPNFTL